ncbi:hypothetical protein RRG08_038404 [Elysia crispata]|uniref:Uncharacterized protein n=1 Tax=Elysia crispata TaxID=231223 RepID=A0AAE1DUB4_9GAST|nr:hypothetical protein RRG08_038404 [Elysia crispata]
MRSHSADQSQAPFYLRACHERCDWLGTRFGAAVGLGLVSRGRGGAVRAGADNAGRSVRYCATDSTESYLACRTVSETGKKKTQQLMLAHHKPWHLREPVSG